MKKIFKFLLPFTVVASLLIGIQAFALLGPGSGGNILTPTLWQRTGTNTINTMSTSDELGDATTRIAKGYFTNFDTNILTVGTVMSGDLNLGANDILNADMVKANYFWATSTSQSSTFAGGFVSQASSTISGDFTAGNSTLFVDDAGNVGIGTTAPLDKLTVFAGNIAVGGGAATTTITYGATGAATSTFAGDISALGVLSVGDGSATSTIRGGNASSIINSNFEVVASKIIDFNSSPVSNLTLGSTLAVNDQIISGIKDMFFRISGAPEIVAGTTNNFRISANTGTPGGGAIFLYGKSHATDPGLMRFQTPNAAVSSSITRLDITGAVDTAIVSFQNSNVGIGTTTPAALLNVYGGEIIVGNTATTTCSALIEGAIHFSKTDKIFWGCDGTNWVRLDI